MSLHYSWIDFDEIVCVVLDESLNGFESKLGAT